MTQSRKHIRKARRVVKNASGDVHQKMADLLKVDRDMGSTVNFGILYGASNKTLGQYLDNKEGQ